MHFSRIAQRLGVALIAALLGACAHQTAPPTAPLVPSTQVRAKIIAFNDFHGNLRQPSLSVPVPDPTQPRGIRFQPAGGVEQFAAVVESLKAANPNNVVVSAGDLVGATPLMSALFRDEPTIEAMNLVGVDFHAVGNHEFDYGVAHLRRLRDGGCAFNTTTKVPDCLGRPNYDGARFQFLAANVTVDATGQTLFPPFAIKSFEGIKVGFIGMTLQGTPLIVRPGGAEGLTFHEEAETVKALIPMLKAQGVNAIVVLLHEGGYQTGGLNECVDFRGTGKDIVQRMPPDVDIVVQAHTHRYYVCDDVNGKLVTSAGSFGTLVTDIDIVLDRTTGKIVSRSAKNVVVEPNGAKSAQLTALVQAYSVRSEPLEKRVVARVSREINQLVNMAGESVLGNVIADAHLAATMAPDRGGAVIAFNNPGSLRAPIIPNADLGVTYGDLFRTQPFQNDLVVMNLTGRQIKLVLEQQFMSPVGRANRLLGISNGLAYTWDASRPEGDRIFADSLKLNGKTLVADLQYRVTANSFVAAGNEGIVAFREGTERQVSVQDLEALIEFLKTASTEKPYEPLALGRITRVN